MRRRDEHLLFPYEAKSSSLSKYRGGNVGKKINQFQRKIVKNPSHETPANPACGVVEVGGSDGEVNQLKLRGLGLTLKASIKKK